MKTYIVASFSDKPFRGNPAGVCLLDEEIDALTMQAIASELRQPETAFLRESLSGWSVRWFSPVTEVALCGHATLAAASVLWRERLADPAKTIKFISKSATLAATYSDDGLVRLDFPAMRGEVSEPTDELLSCIDAQPVTAARHGDRWLLELADANSVRSVMPDFERLRKTGVRSLIITALSDMQGYDIVSRNFAPLVGVNEDQVTGVAHTCLAPHWNERLGSALRCWQASQRGGSVMTHLQGERVVLGGQATIEFSGVLERFPN